jgi:hypothetical protein
MLSPSDNCRCIRRRRSSRQLIAAESAPALGATIPAALIIPWVATPAANIAGGGQAICRATGMTRRAELEAPVNCARHAFRRANNGDRFFAADGGSLRAFMPRLQPLQRYRTIQL